ncbi:site-2 protease family protein [Aliifodinibius sp. S!AR15-10]|uniref:site-2 protease family protein n=1 Tax=Aliifodinibius sp. S!AR15-10 TaxID=2950437 RepID=UPI0028614340|nr:site-2 protease family protein [Aliifodinibius sp. S!AR15-10]MDR8393463.1 site-2 protease family protein [Aliifodinibius sp. S!AR15-10]
MDEQRLSYEYQEVKTQQSEPSPPPKQFDTKTILKHVGLFVLTFITVSFFGGLFVAQTAVDPSITSQMMEGAVFATVFLAFLGVHEFGHFFAAQYHNVKVTLPYFIPVPLGIGTMGAVIRIKEKINDTYKMFDVGVSGPLAGFVVSLAVLLYGFSTLPDPSYINNFAGHEAVQEYVAQHGTYPAEPPSADSSDVLIVGNTLLYSFLAQFFENVPPMYEMYHYPFLFAGWLGLFFTALNLMPVGQLDGGHILYSLLGFRRHRTVARVCFGVLTTLAGIESVPFIHVSLQSWGLANPYGTVSWLIWAGVLFFLLRKAYHNDHRWIAPVLITSLAVSAGYIYLVVGSLQSMSSLIWIVWSFFIAYFVKIEHPPALYEKPLDPTRRRLGWLSMAIFVLCISPNPLYFV